jgi:hypothetical protein
LNPVRPIATPRSSGGSRAAGHAADLALPLAGAVLAALALGTGLAANGSAAAVACGLLAAATAPGIAALVVVDFFVVSKESRRPLLVDLALALALAPFALGVTATALRLAGVEGRFAAIAATTLAGAACGYAAWQTRRGAAPRRSREPAPRGSCLALGLALTAAAGLAAIFAASDRLRISIHGMLHTAILLRAEQGEIPPENPFFAGEGLRYYFVWHLAAAVPVELGGVEPTLAFAATNVSALLAFLLLLGVLGGLLGATRAAAPLALLLGFLSLNALGALGFAERAAAAKGFATLEQLATGLDPIRYLQALSLGDDDRVTATLTKFLNASSFPIALALLVATWLAAAKIARRGEGHDAGWLAILAIATAGCIAMSPITGLTGGLVLGAGFALRLVAGLAQRDRATRGAALSALAALAAGLALALPFVWMGGGEEQGAIGLRPTAGKARDFLLALAPLLVVALPAWIAAVRRASPLAIAALLLPPLAVVLWFPVNSEYKLVRMAAPLLGVFAALSIDALVARRRGLGLALAFLMVAASVPTNWIALRAYLAHAHATLGLDVDHGRPRLAPERHPPQLLYDWLIENAPRDAVVLDDVLGPVRHFAGPLHGAEVPALTGLPVFTDRPSYMNDYEPELNARLAILEKLYTGRALDAEDAARISRLSRPVYVILRRQGRNESVVVRGVLRDRRFERVFDCEAGSIHRWQP